MSDQNIYLVVPFKQPNTKSVYINSFLYGYINLGKIDMVNVSLQKFKITLRDFNTTNPTKLSATVQSDYALVNNKRAMVAHGNYLPFLKMFKEIYENKEMWINNLFLMKKESLPRVIKIITLQ